MAESLIIATVGGDKANSYVTLQEAEEYFLTRLNSDIWTSATEINKEKSLIQATAMIDLIRFSGTKNSVEAVGSPRYQRLQWPRIPETSDPYMLNIPWLMHQSKLQSDWVDNEGKPIIPILLKAATFEQAAFLLRAIKGIDKRNAIKGQGINSISYPNIQEVFEDKLTICPLSTRFLNQLNCYADDFQLSRR